MLWWYDTRITPLTIKILSIGKHMFQQNVQTQIRLRSGKLVGWMTCDFTSFLTIFYSYQDSGMVMMKGCVQWNPVYGWKDICL